MPDTDAGGQTNRTDSRKRLKLLVLTPKKIEQIDHALAEIKDCPYAEIVLVVRRGKLKYIRKHTSEPLVEE